MTTETILIKGEPPCPRPWYKKINPLWWFGNDEASAVGNTFIYKYIRNPMQNFRWYVIGVVDRDHTVKGPAPAGESLWLDLNPPQSGWKWAVVSGVLPYISYSGKGGFAFYLGWQPRGGFGARLTW